MKEFIGDTLIIGLSAALLWHFSNIWRYGQYLITEPNIMIRALETTGLLVIFGFGVAKCASHLIRKRNITSKANEVANQARPTSERRTKICLRWKEYSVRQAITRVCGAHFNRLFVRRATATNAKYTLIGRGRRVVMRIASGVRNGQQ